MLNYPILVCFHPLTYFEKIKREKKGSLIIAGLILFVWFLVSVFMRQNTNFRFNNNNLDNLNLYLIFFSTIGIFLIYSITNWAICTLLDGKGRFHEIVTSLSYSLIPYIVTSVFYIVLSHFVTLEEKIFIDIILYIGILWTGVLIITAFISIHEYSLKKTVSSIFLTIVGVLILLFIALLFYSLVQQGMLFIRTVFIEIITRY